MKANRKMDSQSLMGTALGLGILLLLGWNDLGWGFVLCFCFSAFGVFFGWLVVFLFGCFLFLTFDGACKISLSGIKILAKERAIFFTLAYPLCENCNVTLHHFNWAPVFQVHSVRKDKKQPCSSSA